jgi:hypothetical protein
VWQRHIEDQTSANEAVVAANDRRSKAAGRDFDELFEQGHHGQALFRDAYY